VVILSTLDSAVLLEKREAEKQALAAQRRPSPSGTAVILPAMAMLVLGA
jgi:hypothetical protein